MGKLILFLYSLQYLLQHDYDDTLHYLVAYTITTVDRPGMAFSLYYGTLVIEGSIPQILVLSIEQYL